MIKQAFVPGEEGQYRLAGRRKSYYQWNVDNIDGFQKCHYYSKIFKKKTCCVILTDKGWQNFNVVSLVSEQLPWWAKSLSGSEKKEQLVWTHWIRIQKKTDSNTYLFTMETFKDWFFVETLEMNSYLWLVQ